jgi:hypothetical protein
MARPAVSAIGVRSRKLSNVLDGWKIYYLELLRALERHVKPLVPVEFTVVSIHFSYKEG